jgi:hypothetical protein
MDPDRSCDLILGLQSVRGKIFSPKDLDAAFGPVALHAKTKSSYFSRFEVKDVGSWVVVQFEFPLV